jgi:hypothetical protein
MEKLKFDRRCGLERREFYYTEYTPERRSGDDRRVGKNWKRLLIKTKDIINNFINTWL